jgi:polyferredoxin
MAVQHDIGGQLAAFWRGLRRGRAVRAGALAALALFAALIVPVLLTGSAWPWLVALVPALGSGFWAGFALFGLGLAVALLAIFMAAGWRRRRAA